MKQKVIEGVVTHDEFITSYLSLFAYNLKLTENEFKVLEQIIKVYLDLRSKVNEPYLTELVLSTDRRSQIREAINIEESSFNNIISSLKKKRIFTDEGLNPLLIPDKAITFTFKVDGEIAPTIEEVSIESPPLKPKPKVTESARKKADEVITRQRKEKIQQLDEKRQQQPFEPDYEGDYNPKPDYKAPAVLDDGIMNDPNEYNEEELEDIDENPYLNYEENLGEFNGSEYDPGTMISVDYD